MMTRLTQVNIILLLLSVLVPAVVNTSHFNVPHNHDNNGHTGVSLFSSMKDWFHRVDSEMSPEKMLTATVQIVFNKLGVWERSKCPHSSDIHDISKVSKALLSKLPPPNNFDSMGNEGGRFYKLFRYVLSAAVSYSRDCGLHLSFHHNRTASRQTFNMHMFDNTTSLNTLYTRTSSIIKRLTDLNIDGLQQNIGFAVEMYSNRFLCTDEEDISKTKMGEHETIHVDQVDMWSAAIVFKILKGYTFLQSGEICPGAFLHDIFKKYKCLTGRSMDRMFNDLIHGHPPPVFYQTHDPHNHYDDRRYVNMLLSGASHDHPDPKPEFNDDQRWTGFNSEHPGPGLHPGDDTDWHRSCSHTSNFLHTSHSTSVLNRHAWKPGDKPLSVENMTRLYYGDHQPSTLSYSAFLDICPVMIHQMLFAYGHPARVPLTLTHSPPSSSSVTTLVPPSQAPLDVVNDTSGNVTSKPTLSSYQSYMYGSLAVLVISLCSMLGAVFMKLSRADVKIYIMGALLSLAVGCLVADAALHLLPEVILPDEAYAEDDTLFPDHEKKLCAFLASIYAFFVLELFLSKRQTHSHKHTIPTEIQIDPDIQILAYQKPGMEIKETNLNNQVQKTDSNESQKSAHLQLAKPINTEVCAGNVTVVRNNSNDIQRMNEECVSISSDRLTTHDPQSGIKALAWMIIIGDGIHNFADGLAIGAAFAVTFTKGLSISITVLCHEIPHELGDFAVLISTGLSIKKALVLNFLSSLTAFAGLYVGLLLGSQEEASKWIFSVGAGMFLYVALTDLVPECKEYFKKKPTLTMLLGQNVGLLIGYLMMMLLALYEDKLEINL